MSSQRPAPLHLPDTADLLFGLRRRSTLQTLDRSKLQTAPAPTPPATASSPSEHVRGATRRAPSPGPGDCRRRVRFASRSLLSVTAPVRDAEAAARWYSQEERDGHKRRLQYDVGRLNRALSAKPLSAMSSEQLYECVGLERFTSPALLRASRKHRSDHVRAVLDAQAEQRSRGHRDARELARVSWKSSRKSCAKAAKIAAGYWHVLGPPKPRFVHAGAAWAGTQGESQKISSREQGRSEDLNSGDTPWRPIAQPAPLVQVG